MVDAQMSDLVREALKSKGASLVLPYSLVRESQIKEKKKMMS